VLKSKISLLVAGKPKEDTFYQQLLEDWPEVLNRQNSHLTIAPKTAPKALAALASIARNRAFLGIKIFHEELRKQNKLPIDDNNEDDTETQELDASEASELFSASEGEENDMNIDDDDEDEVEET
jgi:hypothetical protein